MTAPIPRTELAWLRALAARWPSLLGNAADQRLRTRARDVLAVHGLDTLEVVRLDVHGPAGDPALRVSVSGTDPYAYVELAVVGARGTAAGTAIGTCTGAVHATLCKVADALAGQLDPADWASADDVQAARCAHEVATWLRTRDPEPDQVNARAVPLTVHDLLRHGPADVAATAAALAADWTGTAYELAAAARSLARTQR